MKRQPVVWVLTELYRPELTSTGHYLTLIAEHLAADGHDVRVLTAQPTYASHGVRAARTERHAGVTVHRCRGTSFHKDRLVGRLLNHVTLTSSALCMGLWKVRRDDIVIAVSNPPTMPVVASVVSRVRRARHVPLFHDLLPVVLHVVGGRAERSMGVRAAWRMVRFAVRRADRVVAVARPQIDELINAGADASRVVYLPNWADDRVVTPVETSELRASLGLDDRQVALYAGTFGRANDLGIVLDAANDLARRGDVVVVACGAGPGRAWFEREIANRSLSNVVVAGPFEREQQTDMFGIGDVAVVPLLRGMGRSSAPSRVYNALAAGLPVVACTEARSELAMLVAEHDIGSVVDPGDGAALADAIERELAEPGLAERQRRARHVAETVCAEDRALGQWSALIAQMTGQRRGNDE